MTEGSTHDSTRLMKAPPIEVDWFEKTFAELYPIVYGHRTVEAAAPEARFAARQLQLKRSDAILDLCCGNGRHLIHLTDFSDHATGLDYSRHLLCSARELLGRSAHLVRADMRRIPFIESFDAVFNFFTSFGYFEERADNLSVVEHIAQSLKPGGRFFIDYMNRESVIRSLSPSTERSSGEYDIHEERWVDVEKARLNKRTCVAHHGHLVTTLTESVQLYSPQQFIQLLADGGLMPEYLYGGFDGSRFTRSAPRMIAVGVKAE